MIIAYDKNESYITAYSCLYILNNKTYIVSNILLLTYEDVYLIYQKKKYKCSPYIECPEYDLCLFTINEEINYNSKNYRYTFNDKITLISNPFHYDLPDIYVYQTTTKELYKYIYYKGKKIGITIYDGICLPIIYIRTIIINFQKNKFHKKIENNDLIKKKKFSQIVKYKINYSFYLFLKNNMLEFNTIFPFDEGKKYFINNIFFFKASLKFISKIKNMLGKEVVINIMNGKYQNIISYYNGKFGVVLKEINFENFIKELKLKKKKIIMLIDNIKINISI